MCELSMKMYENAHFVCSIIEKRKYSYSQLFVMLFGVRRQQ